jgi:NAD(P)-dependent dehydrogenase (short-subunit alcohol dehydrogenase family)
MHMNETFSLENKVTLVTGASRGLGRNICTTFSEAGANIIAVSRNRELLDTLCEEICGKGGKVLPVIADIGKAADVLNMVEKGIKEFGRIDILINNAGVSGSLKLFKDIEESEWMDVFRTNLNGTLLCTKHVGKEMIGRNSGNIINISSVLGTIGTYFTCPYSVAKAGIIQFTRNVALEWARYNIRVNCISPGMLETDMMHQTLNDEKMTTVLLKNTPLRKVGQTKDVVGAAIFLASEASGHITGENISIDGGFAMSKV